MTYAEFKKLWDEFWQIDGEAYAYWIKVTEGSPYHMANFQRYFGKVHERCKPFMELSASEWTRIDNEAKTGQRLTANEQMIENLRYLATSENWQLQLKLMLESPGGQRWMADVQKWVRLYGDEYREQD